MNASLILKIDIACPNCGKPNSLTLGDMEARHIACSSCHTLLGAARELAACRSHKPAAQADRPRAPAETRLLLAQRPA